MKKIIGQIIKEHVKQQRMSVTEFAKEINVERSNAYNIFERENIDTGLLKKIGQILEYDFFQDLLEPETIKKIVIREATKKSTILVQLDLREDEIMRV
jgi:transcriptional regulator with XRE-family HTH domain